MKSPSRAHRLFSQLSRLSMVAGILAPILAASNPATAQRLTGGVLNADSETAAGATANAIEINPAGIGFGGKIDLQYTFTKARARPAGDGQAWYLALKIADGYHTGLAIQNLAAPSGTDAGWSKFSWAHALRISDAFSLGFAWHTFVADGNLDLDGMDTWDIGLQLRPWRWMAFGLNITDVNTPLLGEVPIGRGYELGISLRPGTERLTIAGNVRLEEDDTLENTYGGRLNLRLFGGFALVGRYDRYRLAGQAADRVMVGLSTDGRFGLGLYGYAADTNGSRQGVSMSAAIRAERAATPSLTPRRLVVEVAMEDSAEYGRKGLLDPTGTTPFLHTLLTLRRLADHEQVAAVLLGLSASSLGWAQAEELRAAIRQLRKRGKKVYAYVPVADTRTYAVATAADAIYTTAAGGLLLTGLHAEMLYLGDLIGRMGAKAEFVAIGRYKSAPEMFTRSDPSEAARDAENALLDDLYERLVQTIADGRGMSPADVKAAIDDGPYLADAAKARGLVDGVLFYDRFRDVARKDFGTTVRFTTADELLDIEEKRWGTLPGIGLLHVVGTITDGKSVQNIFTGVASTGADSFIRAVGQMKDDPDIKAVVLRIDSPGGSVTAADAMWHALLELDKRKPLFVSMGNLAASGGYYVAAPGRKIFASADTFTGSIGIFTGKFDFSTPMNVFGIHKTLFGRGKRSGLLSTARPWTDDERAVVRKSMEGLYTLFIQRVDAGRKALDEKAVRAVAEGRVWTGKQALDNKLVDTLSGYLAAIDAAAAAANLGPDDYRLVVAALDGGLGGLPRSPVHSRGPVGDLLVKVFSPPAPAQQIQFPFQAELQALFSRLASLETGVPLALMPFVIR